MRRIALLVFALALPLAAQKHPNLERGVLPEKMYQFSDLDTVNLFNGNMTIALPMGQRYPVGGSLDYGFTLVYNSKVWDNQEESYFDEVEQQTFPTVVAYPTRSSNAGLGWTLTPGRFFADSYNDVTGGDHTFRNNLHGEATRYDCTNTAQGALCNDAQLFRVSYSGDGTYLRQKLLRNGTRTLQFPNGDTHTFDNKGRLVSVADPFGNSYSISYNVTTDDLINSWTLTDPHGRSQTVYFRAVANSDKTYKRVVDRVVLTAFPRPGQPAATATYQFAYDDTVTVTRGCHHMNQIGGPDVVVPLLKRIILPDGSGYELTYNTTHVDGCDSGTLKTMTLPTLGRYEWTYQSWELPPDECGPPMYNFSAGVKYKRLFNPGSTTPLASSQYDHGMSAFVASVSCTYPYRYPADFANEAFTTVISPSLDKTTHYFSAWARDTPSAAGFHYEDYGLPFTRDAAQTSGGLFLSTRTYDCPSAGCASNATPARSTYVTYEGSARNDDHPRVQKSRTLYNDDGGRYVESDSSDYDGYGHYRSRVAFSNFGEATRTATTRFNPGVDVNGSIGSNLAFPYTGSTWVLGIFDRRTLAEGSQREVEDFCFSSTTGFLRGSRRYRDPGQVQGDGTIAPVPSTHDLIRLFTQTNGNLTVEDSYGADRAPLTFSDHCQTSVTSEYRVTQTYAYGVRVSSQARDVAWKSLDTDVDPRTGLTMTSRDPAGSPTTFTFDTSSRLKSFQEQGLRPVTYSFLNAAPSSGTPDGVPDIAAAPAQVSIVQGDPALPSNADLQSAMQFDWFGRLWREKKLMPDNTWSVRETLYDSAGNTISTSESERLVVPSRPAGAPPDAPNPAELDFVPVHRTTIANYDAFGRAGKITRPDATEATMQFQGDRAATRTMYVATGTPDLISTREERDGRGRLTRVVEAVGRPEEFATNYAYDLRDRLTDVVMAEQSRQFTYDGRGFLTEERHPELGVSGGGSTRYQDFDSRGSAWRRMTGSTNGAFDVDSTLDAAGRVTQVRQHATGRLLNEFLYDSAGNGKLAASARHHYDPIFADTPAGQHVVVNDAFQYDGPGGRVSRRDWVIGNTNSAAPRYHFHATQFYDLYGQLQSIGYPCREAGTDCTSAERQRAVAYTRNRGALTSIGGFATLTYQPNGVVDTITHGSGPGTMREAWTPDPYGMARPSRIRALNASSVEIWNSGSYAYDGAGNVKQIGSTTYLYDAFQRLSSWTTTGTNNAYSWTSRGYDTFGNLLYTALEGCGPNHDHCFTTDILPLAVNPATNRYTAMSYDGAGNVIADGTRTFEYDSGNALTHTTANGREFRYLYTADNERVAAIEPGVRETYTLRGFANQLLSVWVGGVWSEDLIWRDDLLLAHVDDANTVRHYALDHLGSPRAVTSAATGALIGVQEFAPFGAGGSLDAGPLQFTGHERDAALLGDGTTSLPDYFKARYFDVGMGRFLAVDPDSSRANLSQPQTWNRYAYVSNNPLTKVDPNGRAEKPVIAGLRTAGEFFQAPVNNPAVNVVGEALTDAADLLASHDEIENHLLGNRRLSHTEQWDSTCKGVIASAKLAILLIPEAEAGKVQTHHIATDKNIAGGFTKQFEALFAKANMTLQDGANKIDLAGHAGRHAPAYHQYGLDRLTAATSGLKGLEYQKALISALDDLKVMLRANPDMVKGILP